MTFFRCVFLSVLCGLLSLCSIVSVFSHEISYQIHSYNDLREWNQLLLKGAHWLKVDFYYLPPQVCPPYAQTHSTQPANAVGCFLLNHDTPIVNRTKPYNTSTEMLALLHQYNIKQQQIFSISSPSSTGFLSSKLSVSLCGKYAGAICDGSAQSQNLLQTMDYFYQQTLEYNLTTTTTSMTASSIEFILDGVFTLGGNQSSIEGKQCLLNRWPLWNMTYIYHTDPFNAFTSNNPTLGYNRLSINNMEFDALDILFEEMDNWGKFAASPYPFLIWEPSSQTDISTALSAYFWGAPRHIEQGVRFAINIDPIQFQIYVASTAGNMQSDYQFAQLNNIIPASAPTVARDVGAPAWNLPLTYNSQHADPQLLIFSSFPASYRNNNPSGTFPYTLSNEYEYVVFYVNEASAHTFFQVYIQRQPFEQPTLIQDQTLFSLDQFVSIDKLYLNTSGLVNTNAIITTSTTNTVSIILANLSTLVLNPTNALNIFQFKLGPPAPVYQPAPVAAFAVYNNLVSEASSDSTQEVTETTATTMTGATAAPSSDTSNLILLQAVPDIDRECDIEIQAYKVGVSNYNKPSLLGNRLCILPHINQVDESGVELDPALPSDLDLVVAQFPVDSAAAAGSCPTGSHITLATWSSMVYDNSTGNSTSTVYAASVCVSPTHGILAQTLVGPAPLVVGSNPDIAIEVNPLTNDVHVMLLVANGYCYNNEYANKRANIPLCDSTPTSQPSVLTYTYGSYASFYHHLTSLRSVNVCSDSGLVHGMYDMGSQPVGAFYFDTDQASNNNPTIHVKFAEVHRGRPASNQNSTSSKSSTSSTSTSLQADPITDPSQCGLSLPHNGLVLDSWTLTHL